LLFGVCAASPIVPAQKMLSFAYSSEYIVTGSIQLVQMLPVTTSICYFTRISGNFDGDQDSCSILEIGDNWELQYSEGFLNSDIACHARCGYLTELTAPSSSTVPVISMASVNVSQEFVATGQITEQEMIRVNLGVCALTEVGGAFGSQRDQCLINFIGVGTESWQVSYVSGAGPGPGDGYSCGSFCACIDSICQPTLQSSSSDISTLRLITSSARLNEFNVSQEYETSMRDDTVDIGPYEDNFCWLVGFGGNFGSNMVCTVTNTNGRWTLLYLDRAGVRASITCRARCITRNIL